MLLQCFYFFWFERLLPLIFNSAAGSRKVFDCCRRSQSFKPADSWMCDVHISAEGLQPSVDSLSSLFGCEWAWHQKGDLALHYAGFGPGQASAMQTSFVKQNLMTIAQFMLGQAEGGLCNFEINALDLSTISETNHKGPAPQIACNRLLFERCVLHVPAAHEYAV